jgi:hypothetical protein
VGHDLIQAICLHSHEVDKAYRVTILFDDLATQLSRAEEFVEIQHPPSVYDNAQNISAVECLTLESFYHNVHNNI